MDPFATINKLKEMKEKTERKKEQKQQKKEEKNQRKKEQNSKLLDMFLRERNLNNLKEEDKEAVNSIREELESTLKYRIRGTEGEIAQTELLAILSEQNWIIIKLLNEINQKLNN